MKRTFSLVVNTLVLTIEGACQLPLKFDLFSELEVQANMNCSCRMLTLVSKFCTAGAAAAVDAVLPFAIGSTPGD
jgi:hypothetical protein